MNRMFFTVPAATLVLLCATTAMAFSPAPKREVRAVWITTALGLDWPKTTDPVEQQRSLREIVRRLAEARFNTIFFQVRGRADAVYRSRYEPWSQQLTGVLGKDPGWDPLAVVIEEAHARGLEVHAWFNTVVAKNGGGMPTDSKPRHVILAHSDWVHQVEGEWWLDPGLPAVRDYLVRVAMDVVRGYDIDGFQFDYLRYPARGFNDDGLFRKYGRGLARADWRRENINAIAKAFHDSVARVKPWLKIGSAPIGIYQNAGTMRGLQSFSELYQDSRRWLNEGWQDYLAPQVYWTLGVSRADPDFAEVTRDWTGHRARGQLYIGIGTYKPEVAAQMAALVDTSRAIGVDGNGFFRYSSISAALDIAGRYATLALIPPMPWKDQFPPQPPRHVAVRKLGDGVVRVIWDAPLPARDGDRASKYVIYRSRTGPIDIENPQSIAAILVAGNTSFDDTVRGVETGTYAYAVTALDRMNNESVPAQERIVVPELVAFARESLPVRPLLQTVAGASSGLVFVPYEVPRRTAVTITVVDGDRKVVARLVSETAAPGRYVASFDASRLGEGEYAAEFAADGQTLRSAFRVKR